MPATETKERRTVDAGGIQPEAGSLRARPRGGLRGATKVGITVGLSIALLAVGALAVGNRGGSGATSPPLRAHSSVVPAPVVVQSGSLSELISGLQAQARALPKDWDALASLGNAYVQQARITADPTYYPKAQAALERSLQLNASTNFNALVGMAALAAARHDFAGALGWGRRAEALNPDNGNVHDVIGDALIELGRYPEAFRELQTAVDTKPDVSSFARASYADELQGDVPGAIAIMQLALQAAGNAQDRAWTLNQLGDLYFNSGRLGQAEANYRRSIQTDQAFVPPHAGLARVRAARGESGRAIRDFQWVVDRYPLPDYVIALGDLYRSTGQQEAAAQQYGLLHVEEQLFRENGVNLDLEIALFDADHRVDLAAGLAAARAEWSRRHSIQVADALSWELLANGRPSEALRYANLALGLGMRNALLFFHRGMIERSLGMTRAARADLAQALSINPSFSILWSKEAARVLAQMGGAP
jgi:tetratricopeptide (TPR) repeat protein